MTEPPFGGSEVPPPDRLPPPPGMSPPHGPPAGFDPQPPYPPPGPFPYPPPVPPAAYGPMGYPDPAAPYGRHPYSGEPFSDKSKVIAGLLQLLGLLGVLGIGRIYLGQNTFGIIQLVGGLLISVLTCGIGVIVPAVWGIIDAVLVFTDRVRDAQGRPLRNGV